jgi:hypothetical protein
MTWTRLVMSALSLVATPLATAQPIPQSRVPSLVLGSETPVCRRMVNRLKGVTRKQFSDGSMDKRFDADRWRTTTFKWYGDPYPHTFRYRAFDLDNSGRERVILAERHLSKYSEHDLWYVLPLSTLYLVESGQLSADAFDEAERITEDSVDFWNPDGLGLAQSFIATWTLGSQNYVIFQDVTFPRGRGSLLVLTTYKADPYKDGGRWQPMKAICAIRS